MFALRIVPAAAPGGAVTVTGVAITAALPIPNLTLNDIHITFSADVGATPATIDIAIPTANAATRATFGPFDLNFAARARTRSAGASDELSGASAKVFTVSQDHFAALDRRDVAG